MAEQTVPEEAEEGQMSIHSHQGSPQITIPKSRFIRATQWFNENILNIDRKLGIPMTGAEYDKDSHQMVLYFTDRGYHVTYYSKRIAELEARLKELETRKR